MRMIYLAIFLGFIAGCSGENIGGSSSYARLVRMGNKSLHEGKLGNADNFFKRALELNPYGKEAKLGLASNYLKKGDHYGALNILNEVVKHYPEDGEVWVLLGKSYLLPHLGSSIFDNIIDPPEDLENALKAFKIALQNQSKNESALEGIGITLDLLGKHTEAQSYYRQILNPSRSVNVNSNLGLSLAFSGNFKESYNLLEPLGLRSDASVKDRHNLALAYGLGGNFGDSKRLYLMDLNNEEAENNVIAIQKFLAQRG